MRETKVETDLGSLHLQTKESYALCPPQAVSKSGSNIC